VQARSSPAGSAPAFAGRGSAFALQSGAAAAAIDVLVPARGCDGPACSPRAGVRPRPCSWPRGGFATPGGSAAGDGAAGALPRGPAENPCQRPAFLRCSRLTRGSVRLARLPCQARWLDLRGGRGGGWGGMPGPGGQCPAPGGCPGADARLRAGRAACWDVNAEGRLSRAQRSRKHAHNGWSPDPPLPPSRRTKLRVSDGRSSALAERCCPPGTSREPFHVREAKKKGKGEEGRKDRQAEGFPRQIRSRAQPLLGARRGSRFPWEKLIIKLLKCLKVTVLSPAISELTARLGESCPPCRLLVSHPGCATKPGLLGFVAAPLAARRLVIRRRLRRSRLSGRGLGWSEGTCRSRPC